MSDSGGRAVCDDTGVRDRPCGFDMCGAVTNSRVRILPERSDDDLSGLRGGDRSTAAEARKDGDDGSDVVV